MRLINADLFIENLMNGTYIYLQADKEDVVNAVNAEPTVELPHGEWLWLGSYDLQHNWSCSLCGRGVKHPENYCPHCGARMEKE